MSKSPQRHPYGMPTTAHPGEPPHHGGDSAMLGGKGGVHPSGALPGEPAGPAPIPDAPIAVKPHMRGRPGGGSTGC